MPTKRSSKTIELPPAHDWRTTDADEINKRRLRAREEKFEIRNLEPQYPVYSNFAVQSGSGLQYSLEIRDVQGRQFSCDCVDFRINGLGTCKHVEAVLNLLQARYKKLFKAAKLEGSPRLDILPDESAGTLRINPGCNQPLPRLLLPWFHPDGSSLPGKEPEEVLEAVEKLRDRLPALRVSQEVAPWIQNRRRVGESRELRHSYELKVQSGEWPMHETSVPLFPYQREGMLHLAFTERAMLADEMGLGKTIQAIAASALLRRIGKVSRVLVVTPASLKMEWEEQIRRFTSLPLQVVFGNRRQRLEAYARAGGTNDGGAAFHESSRPFFTIVNYEQMVADALDVNVHLRPDLVILDEAQRIKNWNTKTAQAIKRLKSRYAFVLTGTPIENRIDELHSLMDFLNPGVLGPLFAFNREFYALDEKGRPEGFRNLDRLHARIAPYLLRRLKATVETELPDRTDRNHFVPMSPAQKTDYSVHEQEVMKLANLAQRRPLTLQQQEKLQRELAMMRMLCDTPFILDRKDKTCPKLEELERILEDCRENDAKVIVFSEWERMLDLVRELCGRLGIGFAWHTGSVPQQRRRAEINAFKEDPKCRVFLSTDSGATGLNLQTASVVVNCDLPWNPAKLEQRIARAWRKNQTRPVTVVNLISENTIEHRMLTTLATKQNIAGSVLDRPGEITEIKIRGTQRSLLGRLQQLVTAPDTVPVGSAPALRRALPTDPALAFGQRVAEQFGPALVRCEESFPQSGNHSVLLVVVERDAAQWRERAASLQNEIFAPGTTDPMAPSRLEVIDRATAEALEKLIAAGLIARTTRAARSLIAAPGEPLTPPPLTPDELARKQAHGEKAGRSLGIAKVLVAAGFDAEARPHLLDALLHQARACAVQGRLPEPGEVQTALLPPLSSFWGGTVTCLREYVADAARPGQPVLDALAKPEAGCNAGVGLHSA